MHNVADIIALLLARLHRRKSLSAAVNGLPEESETFRLQNETEAGHFSCWKYMQHGHFASREQIAGHVAALREEWDRR